MPLNEFEIAMGGMMSIPVLSGLIFLGYKSFGEASLDTSGWNPKTSQQSKKKHLHLRKSPATKIETSKIRKEPPATTQEPCTPTKQSTTTKGETSTPDQKQPLTKTETSTPDKKSQ